VEITVTFRAEPDDPEDFLPLNGKRVVVTQIDELRLNLSSDIHYGPAGHTVLMETGGIELRAHGRRPFWSEKDS
jgi:hypothetical protein